MKGILALFEKWYYRIIAYFLSILLFNKAVMLALSPLNSDLSTVIMWALTIILIIIECCLYRKFKAEKNNAKYTAVVSLFVGISLGLFPIAVYFSSFYFLENEYVQNKYFENYAEVRAILESDVFTEHIIQSSFTDGLNKESLTSRELFGYISENKETFLEYCNEETFVTYCNQYGITPLNVFDYFNSYHEFYIKFDMNFLILGYSLGYILIMVFYIFCLKNTKIYFLWSVILVSIVFIDTYFDGFLIYAVLRLSTEKNYSINDIIFMIPQVQQLLTSLTIAIGVIAAIKDFLTE